jgi:2-oxoisovalerate dehydrogenase E1 component
MAAVGLKPIVEVQFADYIFPGINQLFTELSRAHYLTNGKYTCDMILRVPIGAYGSGGPYHSSSVETIIANIKGIKVLYPSNGADLKGLLKAAYYDPNPVVLFEHKGLYWSKVPGTGAAKTIEPSEDYILPIGVANVLEADEEFVNAGKSISIITYGMGVHWALNAKNEFPGQLEIVDLRTLSPIDEEAIFKSVRRNNRCLVLTEEPVFNSFARNIAGLIQEKCFESLDAPVMVLGSENTPAIPLNSILEFTMLPSKDKLIEKLRELFAY